MQTCETSEDALRAEIERLKAQVAALTERAEKAEALADHDALTPTLNRRGFMNVLVRQMAYCRRHQQAAALLYIDMDGFKPINDRLGHAAGDAALLAVANLLNSHTRLSDAVGRLGGDEFVVLLMNSGIEDARKKAAAILGMMQAQGFEWEGETISLSASIGVRALGSQADADVWLAEADAAMWLRKGERGTARR